MRSKSTDQISKMYKNKTPTCKKHPWWMTPKGFKNP